MDIRTLKQQIDLHDLAERLGLERPQGRGNYRSPHHKDKNPSLSIYESPGGQKWKDFSDDTGGDHLDLVMHVEGLSEKGEAIRRLHELFGIPNERPQRDQPQRERSTVEFIADQCLRNPRGAFQYLIGRGVPEATLDQALKHPASIGYNDWTSPRAKPGEIGHGGPAAAFIIRDWHTGEIVGVDFRYLDPELNGGLKTKSTGQKVGAPWFMSRKHIERARRVVVVESAINGLCVEACRIPGTAALAIRGTGNAPNIDWRILQGKQVLLALDADLPNDKGIRPGAKTSWEIYDLLTGLNIACQMVDQASWYEDGYNDLADIAKAAGIEDLAMRLRQLEPWAIAGMAGGNDAPAGRNRVFLPDHDFAIYWRFRAKPDFTSYVTKAEDDPDGGPQHMKFEDVCGFRVAAISRVTIQSANATMSGEDDAQPQTVFAISAQVPRHGPKLIRRVLDDERLHNVDQWKKLGPIYSPTRFLRLLNILERTADCGARDAVNFVGLCWRQGKPSLNEGPDCYFTEPDKQCPYHNLIFPDGPTADARRVLSAYQGTFTENAALIAMVWALGAHLKAFTGFWPHMTMQADKGSGKSTLIKRIERSIGMTMFGGQSVQTEFRLLTSISHTSHPVGWEELSARKQEIIDKAVAMLQESYQFAVTRRGSEMTEFLQCAPVLLAGEDVPVKSLTGKIVRTTLTARMGPELPETLPRFPVRQWLLFLTELDRERVAELRRTQEAWLWEGCRARRTDTGASRMVRNYSALATAWTLLAEFAGMAVEQGGFLDDLRAEMNGHIRETSGDREPFVWILETLVSEIESRQFMHPFKFELRDGEDVLIIRPQHVMDHIQTTSRLRALWDGLPVKTGRVFARQLKSAGLIAKDEMDVRINSRRHAHMSALSLKRMADYGVYLSVPEEGFAGDGYSQAANA